MEVWWVYTLQTGNNAVSSRLLNSCSPCNMAQLVQDFVVCITQVTQIFVCHFITFDCFLVNVPCIFCTWLVALLDILITLHFILLLCNYMYLIISFFFLFWQTIVPSTLQLLAMMMQMLVLYPFFDFSHGESQSGAYACFIAGSG